MAKMDPISRETIWTIGYLFSGVITTILVKYIPTLSQLHKSEELLPALGIVILWPFIILFHLSVLLSQTSMHKAWLAVWVIPIGCAVFCFLWGQKKR